MQKGALNADLKKNVPPDDDFGKDFFDSWKPTKLGNDSMDFDIETVPKNKKSTFKFDDLDNFELNGNFDKLSSFKLDMPDLDFSVLSKKNEKANEKPSKEISTGKKESKEDKFSFDFDFNSFDLDSKSLEDKGHNNLADKNVPDNSSKHETNQESSDNISTSNTISKEVSLGKRAVDITEENEKKTLATLARREYPHGKYMPTENSGNQDLCAQTSCDDGSADVAVLGIQSDNVPLNVVKLRKQLVRNNPIQPFCTSPSNSPSPVDSYNSRYWTKSSGKELLNPVSEHQEHQSQDPLTRINGSLTDSLQIRKEVYASFVPKKSIEGIQNFDEKKNQCQNIIPPDKQNLQQNLMRPPLKREFTFGGYTKRGGLMNTGLQLHTISEMENKIPQQSISKPLKPMIEARANSSSANNDKSLHFQRSSALYQTSIAAKSMAESNLQKLSIDATVEPKDPSSGFNMASVIEKSKTNVVSSTKLTYHAIKINKGTSLGDKNHRGVLNSDIAKTIEVSNNKTNPKSREKKSVHLLEKRMDCTINATNPVNIEKRTSLQAPLKRKIEEELVADLKTSGPLKFAKESTANQRISSEASQSTKRKVITDTCNDDVTPVANLTCVTAATGIGNLVGFSSNLEDDGSLRETETYTKGLDNICSLLRKKHEEAKELQVHSIVNNNELLLLNFSMLEENIQELQKFTTSLLLMEI